MSNFSQNIQGSSKAQQTDRECWEDGRGRQLVHSAQDQDDWRERY